MKVKKSKDGQTERTILVSLITDQKVLSYVASSWKDRKQQLFRSRSSSLIAKWCVQYYEKYGSAPNRDIESRFYSWADSARDKELVNTIESFLGWLDFEHEKSGAKNSDYVIDLATEHFNKVKLDQLADYIKGSTEEGKIDNALERVQSFSPSMLDHADETDVLFDDDAIKDALDNTSDVLIKYPGALGKFFGRELCRDSFISLAGPEKRGKSYWLLDFAWRGLLNRNNVAYFVVGDMSKHQVMKRIMSRACRRPLWAETVSIPRSFYIGEDGIELELRKRAYKEPIDWRAAKKAFEKVMREKVKSKSSKLKLVCRPSGSVSVTDIESKLKQWAINGWIADVVVIDYADVLAPVSRYNDFRHQTNETWVRLRGLSEQFHCCLITASQTDTSSYSKPLIDMSNFTEDKRKWGHVTAACGLNQSFEEKGQQIIRLNYIVRRESDFNPTYCVYVAECRPLSHVSMLSTDIGEMSTE